MGTYSPELASRVSGLLALLQGIEVFSEAEIAFVRSWARTNHPRRKYLTNAQMLQARAAYAQSQVSHE